MTSYAKIKMDKKLYNQRKKQGLCVRCGKPMDRVGANCTECCRKNTESARRSREYYTKIGICPKCKKERIYLNERICPECVEKERVAISKYVKNTPERHSESNKKTTEKVRSKRKAAGLCVRCGKRKPDSGKTSCGICLAKNRENQRRWRERNGKINMDERKERLEKGLCWFCGEPVKEGYRTCEECYQRCVKMPHARMQVKQGSEQNSSDYCFKKGGRDGRIKSNMEVQEVWKRV